MVQYLYKILLQKRQNKRSVANVVFNLDIIRGEKFKFLCDRIYNQILYLVMCTIKNMEMQYGLTFQNAKQR